MTSKEQVEAIIKYVDAKVEYELASREEGYMKGSCVEERKAMEAAKEALRKCGSQM